MPLFYGCISVVVRTQVDCICRIFGVEVTLKTRVIQKRKIANFAYFCNYI